ncbi:MAG: acetyl-CoA carboxylase biotin carboxyl carrier protein [Fimbriimonas sp.]
MAELDLEIVRHALGVARQNGFAEVEVAVGEASFSARLDPMPPGAPKPAAVSESPQEPPLTDVKAPMVGYARPGRVSLTVGEEVQKGQVVAVIEALGLANDVESPVAGEIVEVLVAPGDPVQYGQVMARVRSR